MLKNIFKGPFLGSNSNCGILLGILYVVSFTIFFSNFGLYFFFVLLQAVIIFLDSSKIRSKNKNVGPNPILYSILTILFWFLIVPVYIYIRKRYNPDINVTIPSSESPNPSEPLKKFTSKKELENQDKDFLIIFSNFNLTVDKLFHIIDHFNERNYSEVSNLAHDLIKQINELQITVNNLSISTYVNEREQFIEVIKEYADFVILILDAIHFIEKSDRISVESSIKKAQEAAENANRDLIRISYSINRSLSNDTDKNKDIIFRKGRTKEPDIVANWAGNLKEIKIYDYLIPDPLIYWATGPIENNEASCVDISLPIGKPICEAKGSLGYWPAYKSITSNQRANYLLWLSTRRNSDLEDVGYVFLFFYGLEYRALIEKKEIPAIIQEVGNLLQRYSDYGSITQYLSSFLAYIAAKQISEISDENFSTFFPNALTLSYDQVLVALAWHVQYDKPLPWEIAYSLANTIPETTKSVITKKLPIQFKQLFENKFKNLYPSGLIIKSSLQNYNLGYRPASPSLLPYYQRHSHDNQIEFVNIIYPLGKKDQFTQIFSIWKESIEDLKPASRKIGKETEELSSQAYQALPKILKQNLDHPDKTKWDEILSQSKQEDGSSIVPISSLANLIHIEKRIRLTPTHSKQLLSTSRDVGYVLIPEFRITGTPYRWDEKVVLYPLPDKKTYTSEYYPTVALILELGLSIALVDGELSPEEQDHLDRFVFGSFELSPFDIECLKQYQKILIQEPPSLERLGTRLKEHLNETNKIIIAKYLQDMASADGSIDSSEYKALNKIYKAMGLNKDEINVLFPSYLTEKPTQQPIQISHSSSSRQGEKIEPPTIHKPKLILNQDLITQRKKESEEIVKILEKLLNSHESNNLNPGEDYMDTTQRNQIIPEIEKVEILSVEATPDGLHPKYLPFLNEIVELKTIKKAELQKRCRDYRFMLDATVEDINSWSEDNYGDFLFETTENEILFNEDIKKKVMERL